MKSEKEQILLGLKSCGNRAYKELLLKGILQLYLEGIISVVLVL